MKFKRGSIMNISDFLMKLSDVQLEEKNRTIPLVQIIIMYELWKSDVPVLLLEIQNKYNFESYTVHRNCTMLSSGMRRKYRRGKSWIVKNHNPDKYDRRVKEVELTLRGKRVAERLFGIPMQIKK
jgi:DNA-binding MarR family transcriptional regulator